MGELDKFISQLKEANTELNSVRVNVAGLGGFMHELRMLIDKAEEINKNIKPNTIDSGGI